MAYRLPRRPSCQIQTYRQRLSGAAALPITQLLSVADVDAAVAAEGCSFRERLFTPLLTIWIFLGQVLDHDQSCRQAVLRFVAWLSAHGQSRCSSKTGAYCRARQRLPEGVLGRLTRTKGSQLEEHSPRAWHWFGRRVRVADGTTVSMPDTPANQKAYPQSRTQRPGLGFPILRLVVVFSLSVGTVLDAAFNPYKGKETGETGMLRTLMQALRPGDLVLGDRYFANYWIIALATCLGIDVVFRQHQLRQVDFRKGRRLGKDDHLITWTKPQRPKWMSRAQHDSLPATLTLREVRLRIPKGKNRTRQIVVVSTLCAAGRYAKGAIEALYRLRWQAELHLRSLKTTLQMDILRCKKPAMVRKEIWAHLLIYNLIRKAMAQAAASQPCRPWQLSFKGALQALAAFGGFWPVGQLADADAYYRDMLQAIADHRVGQRPDRVEPRAKKRRPKPQRLLNEPRPQARARLGAGAGH
jgi:Transposase DDE domain